MLAAYGCSGKAYDRMHTAPGAQIALVSYADEVEDVLQQLRFWGRKICPAMFISL